MNPSFRPWAVLGLLILSLTTSLAEESSIFKSLLEGKLVAVDGKRLAKYEMAAEPDYFAFYFSAGWCGPCKAFTPNLSAFYTSNPGTKKTFEVIFMSRDETEGAMIRYMTGAGMPWPAVRFRDANRIQEIKAYWKKSLPCLVLVDRQGKIIADSHVDGEYVGPLPVMNKIGELSQSSPVR